MAYINVEGTSLAEHIQVSDPSKLSLDERLQKHAESIAANDTLPDFVRNDAKLEQIRTANSKAAAYMGGTAVDIVKNKLIKKDSPFKPKGYTGPVNNRTGRMTRYDLPS
jgi:hypothetical protein